MNEEDEKIEIVVEEPEVIVDEPEVIVDEPKVEDADLDNIRKQLEAERNARLAAEAEASTARRQARESTQRSTQAVDGQLQAQLDSVENGIKAVSAEADKLEQDAVAAAAAGDWALHAKLTRALGTATGRIEQLNAAKGQIARVKEQVKAEPTPQADDLSVYTPKTQEWIKKTPQFLSDEKFKRKAIAAHEMALANDIQVDTPEYFDYIETTVGLKAERQPPKTSTAAPVTRTSSPSTPRQTNGQIKLSSQEAEVALLTYPGEKPEVAYKKHADTIRELIASGRMTEDRTYVG